MNSPANRAREAIRRAKAATLGINIPEPKAAVFPKDDADPGKFETIEVREDGPEREPGAVPFDEPFDADGRQVHGRVKLPAGWGGSGDATAMRQVSVDTRGGDADVVRTGKFPRGWNPWRGAERAMAEVGKRDGVVTFPGTATAAYEARRDRDLSREQVAERAGVDAQTIRNLEQGLLPPDESRDAIAKALRVKPEELWPHRNYLRFKPKKVTPPPGSPAANR